MLGDDIETILQLVDRQPMDQHCVITRLNRQTAHVAHD